MRRSGIAFRLSLRSPAPAEMSAPPDVHEICPHVSSCRSGQIPEGPLQKKPGPILSPALSVSLERPLIIMAAFEQELRKAANRFFLIRQHVGVNGAAFHVRR